MGILVADLDADFSGKAFSEETGHFLEGPVRVPDDEGHDIIGDAFILYDEMCGFDALRLGTCETVRDDGCDQDGEHRADDTAKVHGVEHNYGCVILM